MNNRDARNPRATLAALVVIALVPLVFYSSMIFQKWEPRAADTVAVKPFSAWAAQRIDETGEPPHWCPYIFSGMPANGSFIFTAGSPFDPLRWLRPILSYSRGLAYYVLFVAAGLGTFYFMRRQGFSRLSSATVSLFFVMTPYMLGNVGAGHSTKLKGLCLTPLFLLAVDYALARPAWWATAFLGGAGALLAWSNHPQIVYYAIMISTLYVLGRLIAERPRVQRVLQLVVVFLGGGLIAAAFAALPYLAVLEYTPYSIRGSASALGAGAGDGVGLAWEYATNWSFHPKELLSFLFPSWFGLQGGTYWGAMPFTQSTHYFGAIALVLSVLALWKGTGRRRWIWAAISVFVLFVGFGSHLPLVYRPLFDWAPYFDRFRVPSMIYGILPLTLGYLVAMGLDLLRSWLSVGDPETGKAKKAKQSASDPIRRHWLVSLAVVVGVWILMLVVGNLGLSGPQALLRPQEVGQASPADLAVLQDIRRSMLTESVNWTMGGFLVAVLACGLAVFRLVPASWRGPASVVVVCLVLLFDLVRLDREFYDPQPPVTAQATTPARGAFEYLRSAPGDFRVFPVGSLFTSNGAVVYGVESIGGYQPAKLRAYQDLMDAELIAVPSVLRMLSVAYVVSDAPMRIQVEPLYAGDGYVYPVEGALPKAWAVERVEALPDPPTLLQRLGERDFDPATTALMASTAVTGGSGTRAFAPASARVVAREEEMLQLDVRADGDAFLVVSEIHYAPGWRAEIDGAEVPIHRVNHVLRGVEVPPGTHELIFRYHDRAYERGLQAGWGAAVVCLLLVGVGVLRRPRETTQEGPSA